MTSSLRFLGVVLALVLGWIPAAALAASVPAVRVQVDPRVELFSILFHLAGFPEYSDGKIPSYEKDIKTHFGSFGNHPAVELARRLRAERGISYDAGMSLAIHVTDVPELRERISFDASPSSLLRWTPEDARAFLELTRQFVKESRFEAFFQAHRPLYELTETRMRQLLEQEVDLAWFDKFFGARPDGDLLVIPGLVNGGACYGLKRKEADGTEDLHAVMGVWLTDEAGQPRFDADIARFIVHELSHSYVNHVVEKHREAFGEAGEQIFQAVAKPMRRQAYGKWKIMIDESLVRASVVRYLAAHKGPEAAFGGGPGAGKIVLPLDGRALRPPDTLRSIPRPVPHVGRIPARDRELLPQLGSADPGHGAGNAGAGEARQAVRPSGEGNHRRRAFRRQPRRSEPPVRR